jgi:hypothetical protein
MRLSEWQNRAPRKESMTPKVLGVIDPVLAALGAEADPSCWIVWGDDPEARYVMLVPTESGLLQVLVRVNVPQEGPRATAKVIRWNRLQVGELALEMAGGHRMLGFQVEGHVLRGTDDEGAEMAAFALELFARIDGRPFTARPAKGGRSKPASAKPPAKPAAASAARKAGAPRAKPPAGRASA